MCGHHARVWPASYLLFHLPLQEAEVEEGNPANDGKDRVALVFDDGQLVLKVGVPVANARLGRAVLLGVLCLSYGDLFSDLALALTNLDTKFSGFSYASLSAIGLSLFVQAITVR